MPNSHSRTKRKIAKTIGYIAAIGLLVATGYFVIQSFQGTTSPKGDIELPTDYLTINGDALVGTNGRLILGGPNTRPVDHTEDVVYKYQNSDYSLKLSFDKPYFPYLAGGSLQGHAIMLKDGKPLGKLPSSLLGNYAPNRKTEPVWLNLCVSGLSDGFNRQPNLFIAGSHNADSYLPVQAVRQPTILSYVYSQKAEQNAKSQGMPCGLPIDFSAGQADFEVFSDGNRDSVYANFDAAISVGEMPDNNWHLALARVRESVIFEDRVKPSVENPPVVKSPLNGLRLSVNPTRVNEGKSQTITISVFSTNSKIDSVVVIPHPVGNRGAFGADVTQMGKWEEPKPDNTSLFNQFWFDGINIDLKNGHGRARFIYSGRQVVAPYMTFSVLPRSAFAPDKYFSTLAALGPSYAKDHPYVWMGGPISTAFAFDTIRVATRASGNMPTLSHIPWLMWLLLGLSSLMLIDLFDLAYWRRRLNASAQAKIKRK